MTDEQYKRTLVLMVGEEWHEQPFLDVDLNPDYLVNPIPVKEFMEREMSEVWENYLSHIQYISYSKLPRWTTVFSAQLNLRNLADYLYEHPSWGEVVCEHCGGTGEWVFCLDWPRQRCTICNGACMIVHPALKYLRSIREAQ